MAKAKHRHKRLASPRQLFTPSLVATLLGVLLLGLVVYRYFLSRASGGDLTPPSVPTGLASPSQTRTSINLTWNASTDPDDPVDHYTVFRNGSQIGTTSSTSFIDDGSQSTPSSMIGITDRGYDSGSNNFSIPVPHPPSPAHSRNSDYTPAIHDVVVNAYWGQLVDSSNHLKSNNIIDQALSAVRTYNSGAGANNKITGIKVRFYAGNHSPSFATQPMRNPNGSTCTPQTYTGTGVGSGSTKIPCFWTAAFGNYYNSVMNQLESQYDTAGGLIKTITMSRCSIEFTEPMIHGPASVQSALQKMGFNDTLDGDYTGNTNHTGCQYDMIREQSIWHNVQSSFAFVPYETNPNNTQDEAFTEAVMDYCNQTLGKMCIIENDSVRDSFLPNFTHDSQGNITGCNPNTGSGGQYPEMYCHMYALAHPGSGKVAAPLEFQTAISGPNIEGDWKGAVSGAVKIGGCSVEIPNDYDTNTTDGGAFTVANLSPYDAQMAANPNCTTSSAGGGLTPGTAYLYTVSATDTHNNSSAQSSPLTATTHSAVDTIAPTVPTGVTATSTEPTVIHLSWQASTDNAGGTGMGGYNIYRDGAATPLGTVTATSTTFSDSTVAAASTHSYKVSAFDKASPPNESAQSVAASATTPNYQNPVVTFANLTAGQSVLGTINVTATTTDPNHVGINSVDFKVDGHDQGAITSAPYSFTWVTTAVANGSHTVSATATDSAGKTGTATVNVTVNNPDITKPTPPTVTVGAVTYNSVTLSWSGATDNVGVTGYLVMRNNVPIAQLGTAATYIDNAVLPSTAYTYVVEAQDAAGNTSDPSNQVSATTKPAPDSQAPTVPANVTAAAVSSSQINLTWTASQDNVGVAGYHVFRNGTVIATVNTTSYGDATVSAGTQYSYTVSAFDAAGNESQQSVPIIVNTPNSFRYYIVNDDFSDANSLLVIKGGTWSVFNNIDHLTQPASPACKTCGVGNLTIEKPIFAWNFDLTAIASTPGDGTTGEFSVIFDYLDPNNYSFVNFAVTDYANNSGIYKVVNGQQTQIADIASTISLDHLYTVEITRYGTGLTVYLNNNMVAQAVDDNPGQIIHAGFGTRYSDANFSSFSVVKP